MHLERLIMPWLMGLPVQKGSSESLQIVGQLSLLLPALNIYLVLIDTRTLPIRIKFLPKISTEIHPWKKFNVDMQRQQKITAGMQCGFSKHFLLNNHKCLMRTSWTPKVTVARQSDWALFTLYLGLSSSQFCSR
jgi:hypothetical protein